jgi:acyl carrier protein
MNSVDELCTLIRENLAQSDLDTDVEIRPDTALLMSGLLDSLTIMRIVSQVENRTGVVFPETELVAANFGSPASLWHVLQEIQLSRTVRDTV